MLVCGPNEIDERGGALDYRVLVAEANTPEWLAARKQGIGASESAVVLGVSQWGTRYSLWQDKTSDTIVDVGTDVMEFGHLAESVVVAFIENHPERFAHLGEIIPAEGLLQSVEWPWLLGTLDRQIITPDGWVVPLEIKSVNDHIARDWIVAPADVDDGNPFADRGIRFLVPEKYQVQVQQQMAVTGAPYGYIAVWLGKERIEVIRLERDDEFIADKLVAEVGSYWHDHVQTRIAPAPNPRDDLWSIWPGEPEKEVVASELLLETLGKLRRANVDLRDVKKDVKELGFAVAAYMQDAVVALHPDTLRPVHTLKPQGTARTVDLALLEDEYPDAYAACVSPGKGTRVHRPTREPIDHD